MVLVAFFLGLFLIVALLLELLQIPCFLDWRIMFGIFFLLNILDWHSTLLIKKKYGIEAEANTNIRDIFKIADKLFSLFKLLFVPSLIFIGFYLFRERFSFQAALNFVFIAVVLHNYIDYMRGGKKWMP